MMADENCKITEQRLKQPLQAGHLYASLQNVSEPIDASAHMDSLHASLNKANYVAFNPTISPQKAYRVSATSHSQSPFSHHEGIRGLSNHVTRNVDQPSYQNICSTFSPQNYSQPPPSSAYVCPPRRLNIQQNSEQINEASQSYSCSPDFRNILNNSMQHEVIPDKAPVTPEKLHAEKFFQEALQTSAQQTGNKGDFKDAKKKKEDIRKQIRLSSSSEPGVHGETLVAKNVLDPEKCTPLNQKDVCHLPADPGPCSERNPRRWYDSQTETSKQFSYSVCGRKKSNFKPSGICSHFCSSIAASSCATTSATTSLAPVTGPACPHSSCSNIQCPVGTEEVNNAVTHTSSRCSNPCQTVNCTRCCPPRLCPTAHGSSRTKRVCRTGNEYAGAKGHGSTSNSKRYRLRLKLITDLIKCSCEQLLRFLNLKNGFIHNFITWLREAVDGKEDTLIVHILKLFHQLPLKSNEIKKLGVRNLLISLQHGKFKNDATQVLQKWRKVLYEEKLRFIRNQKSDNGERSLLHQHGFNTGCSMSPEEKLAVFWLVGVPMYSSVHILICTLVNGSSRFFFLQVLSYKKKSAVKCCQVKCYFDGKICKLVYSGVHTIYKKP